MTRPSTCAAKHAYESADDAQAHVDAINLQHPFCGARSYRCNVCDRFHVSGGPNHVTRRHKRRRPPWIVERDVEI